MIFHSLSLRLSHLRGLLTGLLLSGFWLSGPAQTSLNVTNFNACGDAVQTFANTISNSVSVVVPSASFTSTDVGKVFELFGVGTPTTGGNYQDLVATIAGVVNGTTVILSQSPSVTTNKVYCIYGTQNTTAFQAAIDAAGSNTVINIPVGNYLLIPPPQLGASFGAWYLSSLVLTKGGIHFLGAGQTNTILTGCGAWQLLSNNVTGVVQTYRGFLFVSPGYILTNNSPLIFDRLTMDGGLQHGFYGARSQPASTVDGSGWDETHDAFVDATGTPRQNYTAFVNCQFQHWRGEMLKTVGNAQNGLLVVSNCVFMDGQATALNMYAQHTVENCVFTNMFQVEEYYQLYNTSGPSFFQNNQVLGGIGVAINGGTGTNQPYTISNNVFYVTGTYGILTTPGDNLFVFNNQFAGTNSGYGIGLGVSGYQGYCINSNIWIAGNSFSNICPIYFSGAANGPNAIADVVVSNNTAVGNNNFEWGDPSMVSTNVWFAGNDASTERFSQAGSGSWFTDAGGNKFAYLQANGTWTQTNDASYYILCYGQNPNFQTPDAGSAAAYYLDTTGCLGQCVVGSILNVTNNSVNGYSLPVYYQTDSTNNPIGTPVMLPAGTAKSFLWNGAAWTTNSSLIQLLPPTNLRIGP
jgi:hypothetical protein